LPLPLFPFHYLSFYFFPATFLPLPPLSSSHSSLPPSLPLFLSFSLKQAISI
jgi:hypothetical protein